MVAIALIVVALAFALLDLFGHRRSQRATASLASATSIRSAPSR
jgi:hypothetical protein